MEYSDYYNQLMYLKKNLKHLPEDERTRQLIQIIGYHPDALQIYKDMFLSNGQVNQLIQKGANGLAVSKDILNKAEIKTPNSAEITYRYYGYCKTITPALLNQVIDDIATRIQLENEYSKVAHINSPQQEKEDVLVLDELCEY